MRASIALSTLLGAGAIAQPHLKHAGPHHHNHKRDQVEYYQEGNKMVEEHIHDVYVSVTAGQPSSTTAMPVVAQEKVAIQPVSPAATPTSVAVVGKHAVHNHYYQQAAPQVHSSNVVVAASPPSVTPVAAPAAVPVKAYVAPKPSTSVTASVASSPSSSADKPSTSVTAPVASSPPSSADNTYWSTSPMSPISGGGGSDVLTAANKWRTLWMTNTTDFVWSDTLAHNAYLTATEAIFTAPDPKTGQPVKHNEGGAKEMNHNINSGSNGQCEASGMGNVAMNPKANGLTPFEEAWLMWLCEKRTPAISDTCIKLGYGECFPTPDNQCDGHAQIIEGSFTQLGCYYMNATNSDGTPYKDSAGNWINGYAGIWTCDFGF